ncbi:3-oxoacyl-[acyl-carrier-protein] synthase III C-terminal domain-containing protein [Streptomyces sp. NPDC026589]|uniref:3-oxoacyl-[acyl-carrier-protein] synthase III C-terminal domain-containing protein n=1 Tax=Streptomyces sp. NPDC026589 TaxID=3155609 RepID=UPI0033F70845
MTSGLLAIKSARAVIAGHGLEGEPFGRLVPSKELVRDIAPKRPGETPGDPAGDVSVSFIREKLGIASVATTRHTDALTARALAGEVSRTLFNPDVEAMTTRALALALDDYARTTGRGPGAGPGSLVGHIHLSWSADDHQLFALAEARREVGWHRPGLTSLHILSGCAGLFEALNYAQHLLHHTRAADDESAIVFVTASNDLSQIAHTRSPCPAPQNEDLDQWLFPAIFGEGAGAMIIGHADAQREGGEWVAEDWGAEPVTEDWRVIMPPDPDTPHMVIRARGVGATYRTHVPLAAQRGLAALGPGRTFADLHRLCLHESNPRMLTEVATHLGAPESTVHSISASVGTLAGVSVFALLDEALRTHRPGDPDSVVCALTGDVGNSVTAGHLTLRHHRR